MNRIALKATLIATVLACMLTTSLAQLGQGGAPTGHRHKLRPSPQRPHPQPTGNIAQFGEPLQGLTAAQQAAFEAGREEFESVETPEGGLGPIFNNNACAACHTTPEVGGFGTTTVTRFGRATRGHFDPLDKLGGSLLQASAIDPVLQEVVPREANVVAKRQTTPLFGAGLLEAIADEDILRNAARRQGDGVSGRAAVITDVVSGKQRIGRFGWKAQHANLLSFASDAYLNEMGVTSRFFPVENAPNGDRAKLAPFIKTPGLDDPADPATGRSDIDASADFTRLLAAPPPRRLTADALRGQRIFERVGCAACHMPSMTTGASDIQALAHKTVPLYSDLLLHDMGSLADGIEQGGAKASEMKTAPLWGLRVRTRFLHDGRALNVADAVLAHDGEASAARRQYRQLSREDVNALMEFLNSI